MFISNLQHFTDSTQRLAETNAFFPDMKKNQPSDQQQDGYFFVFKESVY
jgi:hypothetical protein